MKIVYLSDDFPPASFGGAGISTFEIARGMEALGHEVYVVTTVREEDKAGMSTYEGIQVYSIYSNYSERFRFYKCVNNKPVVEKLDTFLLKIKPDVVHANNIHFHLSYKSLEVAKKHAKKVIWTARDTMMVCFGKLKTPAYIESLDAKTNFIDHIREAKKRYNPLHNYYARKYLHMIDGRYSVSDRLNAALTANGIDDVVTVHTGGDKSFSKVDKDKVESFGEKYSLKEKKVLLLVGRLSKAKGGEASVRALAEVSKSHDNALLLIAGKKDGYGEELLRLADDLGIGDRVQFTEWIPREEMNVVYAASDIVLVPSYYLDPFPRVAIEGMLSGKPVIGTKWSGSSEIVKDGETGYVLQTTEYGELADRIADLLEDPQKCEKMGEKGQNRVYTKFDQNDTVAEYKGIYEV